MKRAWLGRFALFASTTLLVSESSNARDSARVQRVFVGNSALAACEGLDATNSNRARRAFPTRPEVVLRARVAGGIGQAPVSDAYGNLFIVHAEPRVSKLDAKGRTLWSERLTSEASAAPVLTSSNSLLIVTRDGEALLYSSTGKLRAKHALPFSDPKRRALAIPTEQGGALLASGSELIELDERGQVVRQLRASANLSAIGIADATLIAVAQNGSVQVARATGDFETVGNFAGSVTEGAAVVRGKVLAVVDGHRWSALDVESGRVATLVNETALTLSGPPAVLEAPAAALIADGGFVSVRAKDGTERARVATSAASLGFDPAQRGLRAALVIGDPRGAIAAVRGGNDVLLLSPDGNALRLDDTSCLDPFRPTPTASGLLFACRSGQLFGVSDRAQ